LAAVLAGGWGDRRLARPLARRACPARSDCRRSAAARGLAQGASEDALRADLGAALLARDDRVEAHRILDKGDFTPDTAALGWRMRGELAMSEGHLPQAGQDFDQALKVAPGDADLWVSIARLRFTGGEEAQAQEAAERAVTLAPRSARALAMRGMMVRARFGLRAGLPWFEQGLRFHPDDAGLLVEYAATLGDMGRNRDMLAAVRRLAQADPGEPRIFYLQAVLAARAGRSELARSLLQRTGTALRDLPGAMLLGGVLEYRAGNYAVAAGLLERLARLQPGNLEAQQLLARVTARSGDNRQVVLRWDAVARQPFAPPYLKVLVARSWLALGQKARGQAMLASADLSRAGGGAADEAGGGRGPFVSIPPISRWVRSPCAIRMRPISPGWPCPMCAGCWPRAGAIRPAWWPTACATPIRGLAGLAGGGRCEDAGRRSARRRCAVRTGRHDPVWRTRPAAPRRGLAGQWAASGG
jgi:Tfp pilus assembly protein PilF